MKFLLVAVLVLTSQLSNAIEIDITPGESDYLTACGGLVELKAEGTDFCKQTFTLNLSEVQNCTRFDITTTDGAFKSEYADIKLTGEAGHMKASFTIPQTFIDKGYHNFMVQLTNADKSLKDVINVNFYNCKYGRQDKSKNPPKDKGGENPPKDKPKKRKDY